MKKLTTSTDATLFLFKEYPNAAKIEDNQATLKKVQRALDSKPCFFWVVRIGDDLYGAVNIYKEKCELTQNDLLDWLPYHGEALAPYEYLIFDPVIGLQIGIIEVFDEITAEEIMKQSKDYYRAKEGMYFFSRYTYDHRYKMHKIHYYWARRIDLYSYLTVDICSGEDDIVHSNERVDFYYAGKSFEYFKLIEENHIKKIVRA